METLASFPARTDRQLHNPLQELIDDGVFELLQDQCLLSEKGIRDYRIRRRFRQMRASRVPASQAIENLRSEYPYLQFDTIRKIVYRLNLRR